MTEPLLCPDERRLHLFPIKRPQVWAWYKTALAAFWVAGEVDLSGDKQHWKELGAGEKHFLSHILAFFASADGIVNENLAERFGREVQWYEARCFYDLQKAIENVHAEMYSLLIDTYIDDESERNHFFNALEEIPCIKQKAAWAQKWIDSEDDFATRLVAFALVEGVFFSASFCAIFWFKQRGLMPGLCVSNTLIARDEGMHQEFATHLYREHIVHKLPEVLVHEMVRDAVEHEAAFCTEAVPVGLIGMNAPEMVQYIQFVADRLLVQLGVSKLYHASNPFPWMELLSLENKTNFFEHRVSEYTKAGAKNDTEEHHEFSTDVDF